MKRFKQIDCWASFLLIPLFVIYGFIVKNKRFITGYFIVGGWQLISMLMRKTSFVVGGRI